MWSQDIPADVIEVLETSNVLAISEFRVFSLAYRSWYGRDTDESTLERHFTPYMFLDEVPFWVRSFTHRILELERQGRLEPAELGIEPPRGDASTRRRGIVYSFIIALSMIGLVLLAKAAAVSLGVDGTWFPPFY